jgi:hypothetical protein
MRGWEEFQSTDFFLLSFQLQSTRRPTTGYTATSLHNYYSTLAVVCTSLKLKKAHALNNSYCSNRETSKCGWFKISVVAVKLFSKSHSYIVWPTPSKVFTFIMVYPQILNTTVKQLWHLLEKNMNRLVYFGSNHGKKTGYWDEQVPL